MRSQEATQFSIPIAVKNKLDKYKAENKEEIIAHTKAKRRLVTNGMAVDYLIDMTKKKVRQ